MKNEDNKQLRVSLMEQNLQKFLSKYNKFIDNLSKKNHELTQIYSLYDELLKITNSFIVVGWSPVNWKSFEESSGIK